MTAQDIQVGKTYVRADGSRRRVIEVRSDSRYPGGYCVRFIVWGGKDEEDYSRRFNGGKMHPGSGFAAIDVFVDLTTGIVNEDPPV